MEKKVWSAPECLELGVENTEKSRTWQGGVDATWYDKATDTTWESHSGTH